MTDLQKMKKTLDELKIEYYVDVSFMHSVLYLESVALVFDGNGRYQRIAR